MLGANENVLTDNIIKVAHWYAAQVSDTTMLPENKMPITKIL